MKRKFICFLTAIMMIVVFIPTFAFADGEISNPNSPPENEEIASPDGAGEPVEEVAADPDNGSAPEDPEPCEPPVEEEASDDEPLDSPDDKTSDLPDSENSDQTSSLDASGDTIYDYDATATHRDKEGKAVANTNNYKAYAPQGKETYEKIQTGQTFTSKKIEGYKCVDVKCSVNHGDRTTFDVKHVGDTWAVFVEPRLGDFERVEDGNVRELDVHIQFIYERTSKITLNCVDTKGKAIADLTSIEVLAGDEVEIVAPDHKITGYAPTGTHKEEGLVAKRVGENRYALQVEEGVNGRFTIEYDKTKTELLYLRVIVDGEEQGTYLIYEGEKNNGASLSTKYAKDTSLCDRIGPHGGECDVHAPVESGVVKFSWIHHSNSNGYNPERMSSDYQLTVDGKKIKSSNIDIDCQESGTDQFDIHIFTATIDTSKLVDVIVHYVDEEGNEIAKSETLTNYEDEDFDLNDIEIKDIDGYENPEVGETPEKYPSEGSVDVYVEYEKVPEYIVTYTDGVDDEEVFKDQVYPELKKGVDTPAFEGTPEREGYIFSGWAPEVSEKVTDNVTYVAQWRPDKVNYAVEYYYQKDGKYGEPDKVINHLGDTGTEATLTSKDIIPGKDGYILDRDNENTIKAAEIKADGSTVLRVYFEEQFNVIIHYVNKETGYEVVEARYENTMKWGEELDVLSPVPPTGYKFEDSADKRIQGVIEADFERWVYYVPIGCDVVIHYVDEDGNTLAEDYTDTVKYGKSFEKASPEVEGYELVNEEDVTVSAENVTEPFTYEVKYTKKEYPVIIHYVDENGNTIADDFTDTLKYKESLEKESPTISGYIIANSEDAVVEVKDINGEFEYTVVYKKIIEPTPDPIIDPTDPQIIKTIVDNSTTVENSNNGFNSESPKTDDSTNVLLVLFVMTLAAIVAVGAVLRKRQ